MVTITHERIVGRVFGLSINNIKTNAVLDGVSDLKATEMVGQIEIFINKAMRECTVDELDVRLENDDNDVGVLVILLDNNDNVIVQNLFPFK